MLKRWVPFFKRRMQQTKEKRFKHRLVRNVLIGMLLTSLFPILLIGTLSYFRSRSLMIDQITVQIQNIVGYEAKGATEFIDERNRAMDRLAEDSSIIKYVRMMMISSAEDNFSAQDFLYVILRSNALNNPLAYFDHMVILKFNGSVAFSTDEGWAQNNFPAGAAQSEEILNLIGTNKSAFVYSPFPGYKNKMVLLTTRSFKDERGNIIGTAIAVAKADAITETLVDVTSFVPGASMYFFGSDGKLIRVDDSGKSAVKLDNPKMAPFLTALVGKNQADDSFTTQNFENIPVVAYAKWMPENNIGIVVEVPETVILRANNILDPFNLFVLAGSLLVAAVLIYFATRGWVNPLVHLSRAVISFSEGGWNERSKINRSDEIGLLAHSFNNMADQLSELYHSLEGVVAKRTSQLRIASEVAQLATSTTRLDETLGRAVELIADRFGFYHVAIYLADEAGRAMILREASGVLGAQIKQRGDSININEFSLVGWVTTHNQARIVSNVQEDPLYRADSLLPDTQSQLAIPISLGGEVLGVLDIQSTLTDVFDEETINVFQTLANQISGTLQISRLLETTQVSYQETALLYRATRQVTQARSEAEIITGLTDAFIQLPYIGAVLSLEGENFKIQVVTDSKTGRVEKSLQSLNIPVGRMGSLLTETRVVLIEDINERSDYENMISFLLRRGCKAAALVSVLENGRLSKVLVLGARDANLITFASLQPYANLAEVIGASLEKYRVLNTLQHRLAELQILATFSQAISAETDLTKLYKALHQQFIQTIGAEVDFYIALYNEKSHLIEFPYLFEDGKMVTVEPMALGEGLTSVIIENGKPLLLSTEQEIRSRNALIEGESAKTWLGIPLIFAGKTLGAIVVQDLTAEYRFTQDDLNLFMTLAPQIATSVRNTQLYTETQEALHAYDQEHFLLNTMLDNIPERVTFKDPHGRFIRISNSLAAMIGRTPEEMVGKTVFDLMDRQFAEKIFHEEQMVMNIGKPEIGQLRFHTTPDGKPIWSAITRLPIRTPSGDPYGLLIIEQDITDLKQAEALAQRRADQMLTAAEIARESAGILEVEPLLKKSINLVRERFGFYHASIFLIDAAGEYAVLRESTGNAGQQMLRAGHRLAVGSKSIVGQATTKRQAVIVNDVTSDPTHLPNPLLPETRSELAIPLKTGDRVLGALDVQSTQAGAFKEDDVNVLQILADQLAVALVNGELFAKAQELLSKHRLLRQLTIDASTSSIFEDTLMSVVEGLQSANVAERVSILLINRENMLQVQASAGYEGTQHLEMRIQPGQGVTGRAALEKRIIRVQDTLNEPQYINIDSDVRSELAIPILFSDELIGVLNLESIRPSAFDENDQEILGALGSNLGSIIANVRLVQQVRQQVVRERQLFDVTSKIRHSVDLETILETSTKEICRALGARRAKIQITAGVQQKLQTQDGLTAAGTSELSSSGIDHSNGNGHHNGNGNNGYNNGQERAE